MVYGLYGHKLSGALAYHDGLLAGQPWSAVTLMCSRCRYKLLVIRQLLQRYDYLMYMDSDAFFLLQVPLLAAAACCSTSLCTPKHAPDQPKCRLVRPDKQVSKNPTSITQIERPAHRPSLTPPPGCAVQHRSLESLVEEFKLSNSKAMLVPQNGLCCEVANTGVMLFRNSSQADSILRDWW